MQEKKVYSVAELAEKIGVPRTTITDWLNRFAQYMEYEVRGKRKVFSDSALTVLIEIAQLRDLGRSGYEIENELAARHPVQAEVQQQPPPPSDSPPPDGEGVNALLSPAARIQADELVRLMNGELKGLARSLEDNQAATAKLARKAFRWQCGAMALLVAIAVAAGVAALLISNHLARQNSRIDSGNRQLDDLRLNTSLLLDELKKREGQIGDQGRKIEEMVVVLDRSREDYQRNVEKLRRELREQQAVFKAELKKQSADAAEKHQAELTRLREDFAARQLEFLHQQEKIAAMRAEAVDRLERREQELREREKQLRQQPDKPEPAAEKAGERGAIIADAKSIE